MKKSLISIIGIFLVITTVWAYHKGDKVQLIIDKDCPACHQAEVLLRQHHIPFTTEEAKYGFIPRLYVNDQYMGMGLDVVIDYVAKN